MAKLIDLFGDNALSGRDLVTSPPKNLNDMAVSGVVSPTGVQYALELANRVTPKVDFSDFSKFVFFNSALDYFNITGDRMIAEYPYDGTYDDYLAFKSASDSYENYMIDAWPHWSGTGHFTSGVFAIVGDTSNVSSNSALLALSDTSSLKLTVPFTVEYRLLFPTSPVLPSGSSITVLAQHFSVTGTGPDYAYPNFSLFLSSSASVPTINLHLSGAAFTGSYSSGSYVTYPIPEATGAAGYYMAWVMTPPSGATSGTLQLYKTNAGANQYPFTDAFNVDGYGVPQVNMWTFNTGSTYSTGSSALVLGQHPSASLPFVAAVTPADFRLTEFRYWTMARDSADIYRTYNNRIFKGEPLQIYWRFAEPYTFPGPGRSSYMALRDYSGHKLDAVINRASSSFWIPATERSGGIGMTSADLGEPLLSPRAADVISFVTENQTSGTLYDRNNANLITNLVPQQFIYLEDDKGTAVMKNLLYLLGRQFDELKVSIDQTKYLLTADYTEFNTTPDAMLDDVLKFWGWSTKGNFLSKEAFQWFFGLSVLDRTQQDIEQGVYSNQRLETELFQIKNEFWRRTLNNLAYLYKTKGTKESVEALFRIYGLDESVVKLKEYGLKPFVKIETNRINSLKSHSVLKIDRALGDYGVQTVGQPIAIPSGTWTVDMQIAFPAFGSTGSRGMPPLSGASDATGSIYHVNQATGGRLARPLAFPLGSTGDISSGDVGYEHLYYEREWRSGTLTQMGRLIYVADDGTTATSATFDNLPIFDGR